MQPPTENPNPTPNVNPNPEPPVPTPESGEPPTSTPTPFATPTQESRPVEPAQSPVQVAPIPQPNEPAASLQVHQPTDQATGPIITSPVSTPSVTPVQGLPVAPDVQPIGFSPMPEIRSATTPGGNVTTPFNSQPVSPSITGLSPSAPNVGGVSLPGSPESGKIYVGGDNGLQTVAATGTTRLSYPSPNKKKFVIGAAAAAGVSSLIVLFVVFFYIPNRPTNVWNTGMNRTGDQMTALIDNLAEPEAAEALQKTKVVVKGSLDNDGEKSSMSLDTAADESKTDTSVKINADMPDGPEMNLDIAVKTDLPKDATLPNIYFKIAGFSALGIDSWFPGINAYDNKWIAVEQDYLKQFEDTLVDESSEKSSENVTQDEVIQIMKDVNAVSQEYIFTADPEKAVIKLEEFVATEESEGIKANHYKAKVDKDNYKDFCKAVVNKVAASSVVKEKFPMNDDAVKSAKDSCDDIDDAEDIDKPFDLWIDKKYKLFHKVRFYEDLEAQAKEYQEKKDECEQNMSDYSYDDMDVDSYCNYYDEMIVTGKAYSEFGQVYKGKNSFFLFAGGVRDTNKDEMNMRFETTIDAKAYTMDGKMTLDAKSNNQVMKGELTVKTEPFDGDIDADKPSGAIPMQEVMDALTAAQPEPDYSLMNAGAPTVLKQLPFVGSFNPFE